MVSSLTIGITVGFTHRQFVCGLKDGLANCVAWVRKGDEEHDGCIVVICNGTGDGEKKCEIGKEHAGEKWTDVLGWQKGEVTIDEGG